MTNLSDEEREKIYLEEKAKREAAGPSKSPAAASQRTADASVPDAQKSIAGRIFGILAVFVLMGGLGWFVSRPTPKKAVTSDSTYSDSSAVPAPPDASQSSSDVNPEASDASTTSDATPVPSDEWTEVTSFSGNGTEDLQHNTETFVVPDNWRIDWKTKEGHLGSQGTTNIFVMSAPGSDGGHADGPGPYHAGSGEGAALEYGHGTYYLTIISNQSYSVKIMQK